MKIEELIKEDKDVWDKFVFDHPDSQVYSLYYAQQLLKTPYEAEKFVNLLVKDGDEIVGIMPNYVANKRLVSRGGILLKDGYEDLKVDFLRFVNNYVRDNNLYASIIYPNKKEEIDGYEEKLSKKVVLSLEPLLEDIWKGLNRKNRNAIRKAKKSDIKITKAKAKLDMKDYFLISVEASKKKRRSSYSLSFYYSVWDVLKDYYDIADVYFAELAGKRIAAAIVNKFNKTATYSSGVFLSEYGSYQPNNLLQWHIISDLKDEGFKTYELGDVGLDSPDPQVRGIAHFKMSWGGDELDYAHYIKYRSWLTKKLDTTNVLVPMVLRIVKRKLLRWNLYNDN